MAAYLASLISVTVGPVSTSKATLSIVIGFCYSLLSFIRNIMCPFGSSSDSVSVDTK